VIPIIPKDRIWPTIIVTVLCGFVVFTLIASRIASHDPNYAIESDYYNKAVQFDSTLAQDRRSVALGWRLTPTLGPIGTGRAAVLAFDVRDSTGATVSNATVSVEARQVAHADNVLHATLAERTDGAYAVQLPMTHSGLWEFRVVATRGVDQFETDVRMNASVTATAQVVNERPGDPMPARLKAGGRREARLPEVTPRMQ
jgi:nitrogen fixation protein FixH